MVVKAFLDELLASYKKLSADAKWLPIYKIYKYGCGRYERGLFFCHGLPMLDDTPAIIICWLCQIKMIK